ncbi:SDR family NAD(P)-dependent oxidoreductase [Hespellia stercorisuis]|uniref:UDP-glucuronate 4-epimerase n=1 Tax=Hespellia stercorisuis DSM 15480 TaxID=1121950 RepID=A0A1M6JYD5_9FIRM|nr:SDR family NAD(P)-dependent oxidoreductase [Hespellia stercorisuis]SHJ51683.1 UDP-glucuronate 4-epimerase [Hespellia stercorisuis DSM 15480]
MRYFITGGAGFIGSHLSESLLKEGHDVVTIDNFCDYYDVAIKKNNLECVKDTAKKAGAKYEFFEGDIRNADDLSPVFNSKVDVVVHLAAMAGVRPSIENEQLYWDVNIMGTRNLLEQCQKQEVSKVVFISSSSIYGNNPSVPFKTTDKVDAPISPYAATKKAGELLCHTYYHLHDMNIVCLRLFTVFGPRQRPDLAINKFTRNILNDEPITLYGDGSTSRDYTYVMDIVQGIKKAAEWINTGEHRFGVFNIGGDEPINLLRMVKTIENKIGSKAKIEYLPMQPGDVERTCADITESTRVLGYKPETSFEEGISNFVDWYKKETFK